MNCKTKSFDFVYKSFFWIVIFMMFFTNNSVQARQKSKLVSSIPFQQVGTYIVIKVKVNDSSPLDLILDSGIRNTMITELLPGDKISINYASVKDLIGLGDGTRLEAYTSNFNTIQLKKIKIENKTVLVLKEDVFNLSKHTGTKINGLTGIDVFQDYVVEINYSSNRVRFYEAKNFVDPKGYSKLPLIIDKRKMYVQIMIQEDNEKYKSVKMLIDTGAELNAWFQTFNDNSVSIPPKSIHATIGQGLNGEIEGHIALLPQICIGKHCLKNVIVSFPDSASIFDVLGSSNRDGTIGSQILSRFDYYIDYINKQFYFKPNGTFKNPFYYNIAGIEVVQILPNIPQTEVWRVCDNSPASKAGVKIGDQIVEINDEKGFNMTINELKKIFETPSNSPIKLKVKRNGEEINLVLDMKDRL